MDLPREFRFEFTPEDYVRFNLDHDDKTGNSRRAYRVLGLLLSAAIAVPLAYQALRSRDPRKLGMALGLLLLLLPLLWAYVAHARPRSLRRAVERMVAHPEGGASLVGPRRVVFSEKGVLCEMERQSLDLRWEAFTSVRKGPDHVHLYFSPLQAVVLPRRCFKTDDEFAAFAAQLESRIGATRA